MNIVYATTATVPYPSAASINTVQMCEGLASLGHSVRLAVGRKVWRWPAARSDYGRFFGFRPSFQVCRIQQFPRTGWWFDAAVTNLAARTGSLVYLRYPRLLPRLASAGVPAILEVHSSLSATARQAIVSGFRDGTLLGVVAITNALRRHLLGFDELGDFDGGLMVAPDAVDPRRFRGDVTAAESRCAAGYVGSLYPGKGMERIIDAARHLPDMPFLVFGGRLKDRLHWSSRCRGIHNVRLRGRILPAEVPERMSSFSIALLPNQPSVRLPNGDDIGEYTSPLKLFEYMASGKAIVASDLPNLREVLTDGHNCLLVKHDDGAAWARAIKRLSSDSHLRQRLSRQALEDVQRKYTYEVRFRGILDKFVRQPLAQTDASMTTGWA